MTPEHVKRYINEQWGPPLSNICEKILDFLQSVPQNQLQMLTFNTLTRVAEKSSFDFEILSAANILSSSEISALLLHAAFIDDDDEFYEISLPELMEAREIGNFQHPATGEEVFDFERHVILYFSVSPEFPAAT